jgi:hypothetical protein
MYCSGGFGVSSLQSAITLFIVYYNYKNRKKMSDQAHQQVVPPLHPSTRVPQHQHQQPQQHAAAENNNNNMSNNSNINSATVTVQDVCDAIWRCQVAEEVVPPLKLLNQALLLSSDDYDPSEAFLAIQGAALRFRPRRRLSPPSSATNTKASPSDESSSTDQEENITNSDQQAIDAYWDVAEEALWAAAALACVCVGPAWRIKIHHRRLWLRANGKLSKFATTDDHTQSTQESQPHPPSEVLQVAPNRSFSPMTQGSTSASVIGNGTADGGHCPAIPEVLPAAMLRFASSMLDLFSSSNYYTEEQPWKERRKRTAVAQRYLVLALCCESPNLQNPNPENPAAAAMETFRLKAPKLTEWVIPGAHDLVGLMLSFWLQAANTAMTDWWFTLGVARAATDLVSTGWRPLPDTSEGRTVVQCLLGIAQKGISLLNDPTILARREQLAVSSSAAEAISALASLGSKGLIPLETQQGTARALLSLHVVSGAIRNSDQFPVDEAQRIFLTQIESCFADTADFLWVLFATQASSANAFQALLSTVQVALPLDDGEEQNNHWNNASPKLVCMEAGTAIRMMSAALWGRPPDVIGIPHLRMYWPMLLTTIRETASRMHSRVKHTMESGSDDFLSSTRDMLSLALDTVVALGNFIDRELVGGSGLVSTVEWETFLCGLEEAFIPWLEYPKVDTTEEVANGVDGEDAAQARQGIFERAHLEIESLLLRVGALLDKCVRMKGSPFHSVFNYASQKKLYLLILRTAVPHMDQADVELLRLSVVRAWCKFGLFPYHYEEWAKTAEEILSEAYAIYENGVYVNSAQVRFEALRCLTFAETSSSGSRTDSSGEDPSTPSDRSVPSQMSLLVMTQDMRELHLEFISKSVIPALKSILLASDTNAFSRQVAPLPGTNKFTTTREENIFKSYGYVSTLSPDNSFALEKYAVRLVGRLIRGRTGERASRALCVSILRSVALDDRWKDVYPANGVQEETPDERKAPQERLGLQGSVRLEAMRELELCLEAPFGELPHIHEIVPLVLETLCAVLMAYTAPRDEANEDNAAVWQYERAVLAVAALVPLSRLRYAELKKLALLSRRGVIRRIPDALIPLLTRNSREGDAVFPPQVAAFIEVEDSRSESVNIPLVHGPKKTLISFEPIVSSIVATLGTAKAARDQSRPENMLLLQTISSFCFNALTSYFLSGYQLTNSSLFEDFLLSVNIETGSESVDELQSRGNALAALGQSIIVGCGRTKVEEDLQGQDALLREANFYSILNLLLRACDSTRFAESMAACRAIVAVLPALGDLALTSAEASQAMTTIFAHCATRLLREVCSICQSTSMEPSARVMQVAASLLVILNSIVQNATVALTSEDLCLLFDLCKEVVFTSMNRGPTYCLYVAINTMVTTIDRMPRITAKSILGDGTLLGSLLNGKESSSSDVPTADFIRLLLSELLGERMQSIPIKESQIDETDPVSVFKQSDHESLASELESMELFEVEDSGKASGRTKVAWLCGECVLLTFRLGSSTSRYRGWVEIVVRSPVSRKRVMVRLLSRLSLNNPDIPSKLFMLHRPDLATSTSDSAASSSEEKPAENYSSDILKSLIARFDRMLPPASHDDYSLSSKDAPRRSIKPDSASMDDILPYSQARPPIQPRNKASPSNPASEADNKRLSSSSSATEKSTYEHEAMTDTNDSSIHAWLMSAFGNDRDKIKDVELALRKLNFSKDLIYSGKEGNLDSDDVGPPANNRVPVRRLQQGPKLDRAIAVLDRTTPSNTHKAALLYSGPRILGRGDSDERTLLETTNCSPAYHRFSNGLGEMVLTKHLKYFSAGLDVSEYQSDGQFTRAWIGNEDTSLAAARSIVVFHVVGLMPEGINNRKRHVGNDNVLIVFEDRDAPIASDVDLTDEESVNSLVGGHFGFVTIYVSMLPQPELQRITVRIRKGLPYPLREELVNFAGSDIIASKDAPSYVRGLAIRADTACRSVLDNLTPALNCHERYRILRGMNRLVVEK